MNRLRPQELPHEWWEGLRHRLSPEAHAAVRAAHAAHFGLHLFQRDEAGNVHGAECPGCSRPVFGRVRIGVPTRHPVTGETEWNTALMRLPAARFVTVDLGEPGAGPAPFTRLTYCAGCAETLVREPGLLAHAVAADAGHFALLAHWRGRHPDQDKAFLSWLATVRPVVHRTTTVL